MTFNLNILKAATKIKSTKELVERLTFLGYEVEKISPFIPYIPLKVGKILKCEKHKNANSLNVCEVEVNNKQYTIVCGAKNVVNAKYVAIALPGTKINGITIKKRNIRGIESCGMICSMSEIGVPKELLTQEDLDGIAILDGTIKDDVFKALALDFEVIEISILKNREYAKNYNVLIHELNASKEIDIPKTKLKPTLKNDANIKINTKNCSFFSIAKARIDNMIQTPSEIKSVLYAEKIRSINFAVDLANYVMLIIGHPLHLYDAQKQRDFFIKETKGVFEALDTKSYNLKQNNIVIVDKDLKISCLAGVIGSKWSSVQKTSFEIFIEVANFNGKMIQTIAKELKINSHASLLFSNNLSNYWVESAINLFFSLGVKYKLIKEISEIKSTSSNVKKFHEVYLPLNKIHNYLGEKISQKKVNLLLKLVDIKPLKKDYYLVPNYRTFINVQEALIEEIIRLKGINDLEMISPKQILVDSEHSNTTQHLNIIKLLANKSLNNIKTYSLVNQNECDLWNIFNYESKIKIDKFYNKENSIMRLSLLPSLIKVINFNINKNNKQLGIFEVADIYTNLNKRVTHLAILMEEKEVIKDIKTNTTIFTSVHYLKALLFDILNPYIDTTKIIFKKTNLKQFNPFNSFDVFFKENKIGIIGEIHPFFLANYKNLSKLLAIEIDITNIVQCSQFFNRFNEISNYQKIEKDLTINLNEKIDIKKTIDSVRHKFKIISNIEVISLFKKMSNETITFRITITPFDKNLTHNEINKVVMDVENEFKLWM